MSVPYLGLTRKYGERGKHKAHGRLICREAGSERETRSHTYDSTLSHLNVYDGYESGEELWERLESDANEYRVKVKTRDKKTGKMVERERGLRKDAIVGFAVIWKPPADVIREWDRETRERFFADCYAVAEELEPELFQPSNIRMRARHNDERLHGGEEHEHVIGVPLTKDGRYSGSDMLNHMRRNFNRNFARHMRERGWDMDDLDLYDPERARTDPLYLDERRERRKHYGLSVTDHAADEAEQREAKAIERAVEAEKAAREVLRVAESAKIEAHETLHDARMREREINERALMTQENADDYDERTRRVADEYARETMTKADAFATDRLNEAEADLAEIERDASEVREELNATASSIINKFLTYVGRCVPSLRPMCDKASELVDDFVGAGTRRADDRRLRRDERSSRRRLPSNAPKRNSSRDHGVNFG